MSVKISSTGGTVYLKLTKYGSTILETFETSLTTNFTTPDFYQFEFNTSIAGIRFNDTPFDMKSSTL